VSAASAGGLALSACLDEPAAQAASTLGAKTPTARVVSARRRVTGEMPRSESTTSRYRRKLTASSTCDLQTAADQHRLGYQCDAKHIPHAVAHGAGERENVVGT